jgi:subtilisin family serine protease
LRETIDPDDFAGGFGTWSGTSFAAPVVAGLLACALFDDAERDDRDVKNRIERARHARERILGADGS